MAFLALSAGSRAGEVPAPIESVTLSADAVSPVDRGEVVRFTAEAVFDGGEVEYQFLVKGPRTCCRNERPEPGEGWVWKPVRGFDPDPSFDWDTTAFPGPNAIAVWARRPQNLVSATWPKDWLLLSVVDDEAVPVAELVLDGTPPPETPITERSELVLSPSPVGTDDAVEYQFWRRSPLAERNDWGLLRDWSTEADYELIRASETGPWVVGVFARSVGSPRVWDALVQRYWPVVPGRVESVEVVPPRLVNVINAGAFVNFKSRVMGTALHTENEFLLRGPQTGNEWEVMRPYPANEWGFVPDQLGTYLAGVRTRREGNTVLQEAAGALRFEVVAAGTGPVDRVFVRVFQPDDCDEPHLIEAEASGGRTPYEYRFWRRISLDGSVLELIRDYGPESTHSWLAPRETGRETVIGDVRTVGSAHDVEARASWSTRTCITP